MNIVVIGAGGFLGNHLLRSFLTQTKNFKLTVFSSTLKPGNPSYKIQYYHWPENSLADAVYKQAVCNADIIIYAAGAGIQPKTETDERTIYELNLYEPARLVTTLTSCGFKGQLISFGSYFELGVTQLHAPFDEKKFVEQLNPLPNAYCVAKKQFTIFYHIYENISKPFKWLHLVLTNIYGPGENENRLIPYIISEAKSGKPLHFTQGIQKRQYTFIADVINVVHSLLGSASGIYHVTNKEVVTVKDVILEAARQVEENCGLKPTLHFDVAGGRDTEMNYLALNPAKLYSEWNLACDTSYQGGIHSYFKR